MHHGLKMLSTSFVIAFGLGTMSVAHAAPEATENRCWGDITSQFAQTGTFGQHASDPPGFTPGEGGRRGVGNVSKEDFGPLSEGGQGEHAEEVGGVLGFECE
jgi:hypothetical protein